MQTSSNISRTVMRRVAVIHAVRPFVSARALAAALLLLAAWGIGREVWVAHVVANLQAVASSPDTVLNFFVAAFINARFVVQALSVTALAAAAWMVSDALRLWARDSQFA